MLLRFLPLVAPALLTLLLSCQTSPDLQGGVDADFEDGLDAYKRGNYAAALSTWQPLAEQGDARAQGHLGAMYYEGSGVPRDYVQAHMWFNLAAAQGHRVARKGMEESVKRMPPAQLAEAQRLAREWTPKAKQ